MKKNNYLFLLNFMIFGLLLCTNSSSAQTISSHFFGENAWMPDTIGNSKACNEPPCILNGKLHKQWKAIKNSSAGIIRFGGIAADKNMPTNFQYIRMIDSIQKNGMEPIIQVPFAKGRYTATQAADIVKYINVTKGKKIKYWIIANEPDLGYSYTTASQIANYFKPFASAMKAIDPSIIIIGPEIASFNKTILNGLTTPNGPDDITGRDEAGRYYLDIISFHTYPFNGSQTRDQVISKLMEPNSLDANLVYLNGRVASCNTFHNRTGTSQIKTAITEANINWKNSASDNLYGVGANSFIGGQFIAEMMGIGMKNKVDFVNIWSVIEGNTTESNIGFIDPGTSNKKPSYHHFKLLADNFKGTYVNGSTNKSTIKSFGSRDAQNISVLILNEDMVSNYNYIIRLNTDGITGNDPLKINIDAGIASEYNDIIKGQSSVLLTFNSTGNIIKRCEYSLNEHALSNLAPTCTEFTPTSASSNTISDDVTFEMNIFPNPSMGKFSIQLNTENIVEKRFEVVLFNLVGQEVYRKKSSFLQGKEDIELDPSIATGEYIVQVREENNNAILTKKIIIQQ